MPFKLHKIVAFSLCVVATIVIMLGCTRDDICPEGSETTPLVVVAFKDVSNPNEAKAVPNLRVSLEGFGGQQIIGATTDTLVKIPLNTNTSALSFNFTRNAGSNITNTDRIDVTYSLGEKIYINRACSFKTTFENLNASLVNEGVTNWIQVVTITNENVLNEDVTHITVLH